MSANFADYWSQRYAAGGHFVTRHCSQYLGAACAWAAQRAGLPPSAVTLLGAASSLAGAAVLGLAPSGAGAAVACLVLLQLGYVLDCADGQLARATQRTSAFGAWLDVACDHLRNVALAGAIALWLSRHHEATLGVAAALLYASGTAVYLHTVEALRRGAVAPAAPRDLLRELVTGALDTPTVLLALALLRGWPGLLGAAGIAAGIAYFLIAVLLARARL